MFRPHLATVSCFTLLSLLGCPSDEDPNTPESCQPPSCDDSNPCTTDRIEGSGCDATCAHDIITEALNGDQCCPAGANSATDDDCQAACGNGALEAGEHCDTGIASGSGACPGLQDCDDADPCTDDSPVGAACDAHCEHNPVVILVPGDQCCPDGATPATDPDCGSILCGNGALEAGELCDPGIASGPGACPTSCDDGQACTEDILTGTGCQASCEHPPITVSIGGDACCPTGANATTDPDCTAVCGNQVVEPGELCDTAIAGSCLTAADCMDGRACTSDLLELENGDPCRPMCRNPEITMVGPQDGCCPTGGTPANDSDCAGCGDGVVAGNETCDTAIASGPNSCPTLADCDDGDPCTTDGLVGQGTCSAECTHAPNNTLTNNDACCLDPGNTFPSVDNDCPTLGPGFFCNSNLDCQSNRCELFSVAGQSMCTSACDPQSALIESNCPTSGNWQPLCISQTQSGAGGSSNACVYIEPGAVAFSLLTPGNPISWGFNDPAEGHFYMLPSYGDGIARNWQIDLVPTDQTLNVAGRSTDPALSWVGQLCDAAAAGASETCQVQVAGAEASERFWFAVGTSGNTIGNYTITLTLLP